MIVAKVKVGRTTITLEQDFIDGLFSVVKGRETMFVSDNENSAKLYFEQLTGKAA